MASIVSAVAIEDLHSSISSWLARYNCPTDLRSCEQAAVEVGRLVSNAVFEYGVLKISGKATYCGTRLHCKCGGAARFVGYRNRWVRSMVGEVRLDRAYYHCSDCNRGRFPWDDEQGLSSKVGTPSFNAAVCNVMGRVPYAEGVTLIQDLCGVSIEESSAEGVVLDVGARVREAERTRVNQVKLHLKNALAEKLMEEVAPDQQCEPLEKHAVSGTRLYMSVDATTAHISNAWHNVQNAMVFNVKPGTDGCDELNERAYLAGQMDMDTLGWRLRTLSEVWQAPKYAERLFLADGAPCNWTLVATHFPDAILILDFWHASEHIWELSRVLYRQDDPKQKALGDRWATQRVHSLKHEGPAPLLRALKRRKTKTKAQTEALRQALHYFINNRDRMRYPEHIKAGRMIGSGPMEAGCKTVTCVRVKRAGMRWSEGGIDALLAVRVTLLNGDADRLITLARAA